MPKCITDGCERHTINADRTLCPDHFQSWHERHEDNPYEEVFLDTLRNALVNTDGLDSIPEPSPIIEDTLYRDSLAWIQGKRSNGKSFVALDMAGCIGTGERWHGRPVKQGNVLYIAAEGVSGVKARVRAWEEAMGRPMHNVTFLPMPVQANSSKWNDLIALTGEFAFDLIVIDTQARVTVGMEENAAKDMGQFVDKLERLRQATGACVLVVHHMGRNGDHMRGSTALEGAATTIIQVVKNEDELAVTCEKQKDAAEFEEFMLRMVAMGNSVVLIEGEMGISTPGKLAAAYRTARDWHSMFGEDEVASSKLVDALDLPRRTAFRHIRELQMAGIAGKREVGRSVLYWLTRGPDPKSGSWQ